MPGLGGYRLSSSLQVLEHDDFLSILSQFLTKRKTVSSNAGLYDSFLKVFVT
jgi:hypothetical protein